MSAHTPGPWKVGDVRHAGGYQLVTANDDGGYICEVQAPTNRFFGFNEDEREANARLIAAAPDLLALAHQYADECGDCAGTRVVVGEYNAVGTYMGDEPCTACTDIWTVIDKAEGKS